jgi:MFS family permease
MANNGMQMIEVARGWLVYTMTDSALALGLVAAGIGVPLIIFSAFGGVVADRVRKKNLIFVTQICLGFINLILAILITTQNITLWHLVVASFLMGIIFSFSMPTRQAFIVELVSDEELTNAIAMNSVAMNVCRIASPALAGILIKIIGIGGVYWLVVLSYVFIVFTITRIRIEGKTSVMPNVPILHDVVAGVRFIGRHRILLPLLIIAVISILFATSYQTLMPVFAKTIFQKGETGLGILMSAAGIGALCGSTFLASLGDIRRKGLIMIMTGSVFGSFQFFFGFSGSFYQALFFLFFVGAGGSMYMTLIVSLIMGHTPQELTGRVMSIFTITFGLMPLAMLPAGALAEAFGAPIVVSVGGGILVLFLFLLGAGNPFVRKID